MPERTIAYELVGDVHVAVLGEAAPSAEDWKAYVAAVTGSFGTIKAAIVQTAGGRPNAEQRRAVTEFWRAADNPPKFCLLTESKLIRGMLETLKLFLGDTVAGFAFNDFQGAASRVGTDATALTLAAERLRTQLGSEA